MAETKNVLAFDLGASSGRGILARFDGKKLVLEEIHRFIHNFSMLNGHAYWNILSLMDEMKAGMRKCTEEISGVGFDTWGVDCGFLSAQGDFLSMPLSYRDPGLDEINMQNALLSICGDSTKIEKAEDITEELFDKIEQGKRIAFEETGISSLAYNTIYKLYYMMEYMPSVLEETDKILLLPNLIEYFFSGVMHTEYSIASTTQLYNVEKKSWASGLYSRLGFLDDWFTDVELAGRDLGALRQDTAKEVKQKNLHVISSAGHDTACAAYAVPAKEEEYTFLSSGTWSLMGIASKKTLRGDEIIKKNISNEGTFDGGYRPTVNIIGLWIQNEIKRNFAAEGREYTFRELTALAEKEKPLQSFIDPDDFMQPGDYPEKIREYCRRTGQPVPKTDGALIRCILESLALKYRQVYEGFKPYITWEEKLYIVGGGTQNELLTKFTANALGIPVITGVSEATAVGNVMSQLKALGVYQTGREKSEIIANSFGTEEILPEEHALWQEAYERFAEITGRNS